MNHPISRWNVLWLIPGLLMLTHAVIASDSIVGWTTKDTVVSDGKNTTSSGSVQPIYMAPDVGKYILIDGKRYVESADHRFILQPRTPPVQKSNSQDDSNAGYHHRSGKHHHKKGEKNSDEWKRIDAERNASMTPSQKVYRDINRKNYPQLFEK